MQYSRRAAEYPRKEEEDTGSMANKFEGTLERWVFASRWLLAPFFIGLVLSIAILLVKFVQTFWERNDHQNPVAGRRRADRRVAADHRLRGL
jgi:hypothetical protein